MWPRGFPRPGVLEYTLTGKILTSKREGKGGYFPRCIAYMTVIASDNDIIRGSSPDTSFIFVCLPHAGPYEQVFPRSECIALATVNSRGESSSMGLWCGNEVPKRSSTFVSHAGFWRSLRLHRANNLASLGKKGARSSRETCCIWP